MLLALWQACVRRSYERTWTFLTVRLRITTSNAVLLALALLWRTSDAISRAAMWYAATLTQVYFVLIFLDCTAIVCEVLCSVRFANFIFSAPPSTIPDDVLTVSASVLALCCKRR